MQIKHYVKIQASHNSRISKPLIINTFDIIWYNIALEERFHFISGMNYINFFYYKLNYIVLFKKYFKS